MKFSIIVPTFNRKGSLKKCLESLLSQDYPVFEYEIIVIDDGSKDGTQDFLKTYRDGRIRAFFNNHGGPAKARNFGAKNSYGIYLAFTDDDCLVSSSWLKELETGFSRWSQAGAVGGYLEAPDEVLKSKITAKLEAFETREIYKAGDKEYLGGFESPAGGTNNIAYRKVVFDELGGFDENFPEAAGEDADLKFRAVKAGYKIGYLPLKVIHLDPYSFGTFLKRSIRSGIGSSYFEKKNFNKSDTVEALFISLVKNGANFGFAFLTANKLQALRYLKGIFMIYGRTKLLLQI